METKLKVKNKIKANEVRTKPFNFVIQNEDKKERLLRIYLILESSDTRT